MTTIEKLLQKPLNSLSSEELEIVLNHRRNEEKQASEKERKQFEKERDQDLEEIFALAAQVEKMEKQLKDLVVKKMEKQQEKLNEYGKIKSSSKGGFSSVHSDKTLKIRRRRDTQPIWDERSTKALELIHAFLNDFVKKRDQKMFEILMGFLTKNKKGDLEYSSVMNLLQHEDKFDDKRWKEGLRLIKESYSSYLKGYQYDFEKLNETTGKYERIELNFSAL